MKSPMTDHNSNIKVADLFNQGKTSWEDNLLVNLFNQQEVNLIKSIPISDTKCGDKIIWVEEEKGDFTVKSCYGNLQVSCKLTMNFSRLRCGNLSVVGLFGIPANP